MTTEDTLAAIRERADRATQPPWHVGDRWVYREPLSGRVNDALVRVDTVQENCEFIAAARQDVPRLADAVDAALGLYRLGAAETDDQTVKAEVRGYNRALDEVRRAIDHGLGGYPGGDDAGA